MPDGRFAMGTRVHPWTADIDRGRYEDLIVKQTLGDKSEESKALCRIVACTKVQCEDSHWHGQESRMFTELFRKPDYAIIFRGKSRRRHFAYLA